MSRAEQFKNVDPEQKTITVEGKDGPKEIVIQKVTPYEVVRAGKEPIMFQVSEGENKETSMSSRDSINFALLTLGLSMVDPKLWPEFDRLPSATPPGFVHWKTLAKDKYLDPILAECMQFSGIGDTQEVLEAARTFREESAGATD